MCAWFLPQGEHRTHPSAHIYLQLLYEPIGLFVQLVHQSHLGHFDLVFHLPVLMLHLKNPVNNRMRQSTVSPSPQAYEGLQTANVRAYSVEAAY